MFVDEITLDVYAGTGGNGCLAFRREKYIEMGGPYGGNGGKGSDIVFKVDEGLNTLIDLRYMHQIKGKKGENGMGKGMHGKNATDVIIKVPLGTVVTDVDTGLVIADLISKDDEAIIALGGRGGRGNMAFATHNNPAPNYAENGCPGEIKRVKVEIKLLADVGLVGMPSVGKSTIISMISSSKAKIAAYHFTTLSPNLGVVKYHDKSFVVADLPGLIEGASQGDGLGIEFLKHVERTRVIAHVIDMSGMEGRDPYQDYLTIRKELEAFNKKILTKKEIIIANKMDVDSSKQNLIAFKMKVKVPIFEISAINHQGLDEVVKELSNIIDSIPKEKLYEDDVMEKHVLYKFQEEIPLTIQNENNEWVIKGEKPEKLLLMTKFNTDEAALRFSSKLKKMGIDNELKRLGAKEGDTIRILDYEFEYKE